MRCVFALQIGPPCAPLCPKPRSYEPPTHPQVTVSLRKTAREGR